MVLYILTSHPSPRSFVLSVFSLLGLFTLQKPHNRPEASDPELKSCCDHINNFTGRKHAMMKCVSVHSVWLLLHQQKVKVKFFNVRFLFDRYTLLYRRHREEDWACI